MAKITKAGGLTDISVRVLLPGVARVVVGEAGPELEDPCPGSSSETSPAQPPTNAELGKPNRPKPARTTGNPSKSTSGSTTVRGATTNGRATDA